MEKRKILRGNFVNIFTKDTDSKLARSSEYILKITEDSKNYFYYVDSSGNATDLSIPPQKWFSAVLTEWEFLPPAVRRYHIIHTHSVSDNDFDRDQIYSEKDYSALYKWAEQFAHLLPREVVLRVYYELECEFEYSKFKSIVHKKTYKTAIYDGFRDVTYKVEIFLIDNSYYLYLARKVVRNRFVDDNFCYQIKSVNTVKKEQIEFQRNSNKLKDEFSCVPYKFITFLLNAASNDMAVAKQALQDVITTRKISTSKEIAYCDQLYIDDLISQASFVQEMSFEYFFTDWRLLKNYFKFANHNIKNEIANYMAGK